MLVSQAGCDVLPPFLPPFSIHMHARRQSTHTVHDLLKLSRLLDCKYETSLGRTPLPRTAKRRLGTDLNTIAELGQQGCLAMSSNIRSVRIYCAEIKVEQFERLSIGVGLCIQFSLTSIVLGLHR